MVQRNYRSCEECGFLNTDCKRIPLLLIEAVSGEYIYNPRVFAFEVNHQAGSLLIFVLTLFRVPFNIVSFFV
jgi:hypothetical protein